MPKIDDNDDDEEEEDFDDDVMMMMTMMILMCFLHPKGSQTQSAPEGWGGGNKL